MPRRVRWLLLPVVLAVVSAALARPEAALRAAAGVSPTLGAPRLSGKVDTVQVLFQCRGTRSVSPWAVRITSAEDSVVWVLDPASDVDEIEIEPKRRGLFGERWPFQRGERRGNKQRPATQAGAKPERDAWYEYNIVSRCPGPGNSTRRTIIDPDIIIDF